MSERCCDPPCKKCGQRGNFDGFNTGFLAGVQWAAYETYLPNIDAAIQGDSCGGSTAANTLTVSDSPATPTAPTT